MSENYTSKDIVKMAVQAKKRGVEMDLALARNSENFHVGKLFTEFAKDEQRHKMQLEKWIDKLQGAQEEAHRLFPGNARSK